MCRKCGPPTHLLCNCPMKRQKTARRPSGDISTSVLTPISSGNIPGSDQQAVLNEQVELHDSDDDESGDEGHGDDNEYIPDPNEPAGVASDDEDEDDVGDDDLEGGGTAVGSANIDVNAWDFITLDERESYVTRSGNKVVNNSPPFPTNKAPGPRRNSCPPKSSRPCSFYCYFLPNTFCRLLLIAPTHLLATCHFLLGLM